MVTMVSIGITTMDYSNNVKKVFYCREIGEGGWRVCSKKEYEQYSKYPEMDTKVVIV